MELKPAPCLPSWAQGEFGSGDWCRFCKALKHPQGEGEEHLKLAQMEFRCGVSAAVVMSK